MSGSEPKFNVGNQMPMPAMADQRQITAILPTGLGHTILELLSLHCGLSTASLHRARGVGIVPLIGKKGVGAQIEWDLISVIVPPDRADEIFALIFHEGEIDRPTVVLSTWVNCRLQPRLCCRKWRMTPTRRQKWK